MRRSIGSFMSRMSDPEEVADLVGNSRTQHHNSHASVSVPIECRPVMHDVRYAFFSFLSRTRNEISLNKREALLYPWFLLGSDFFPSLLSPRVEHLFYRGRGTLVCCARN